MSANFLDAELMASFVDESSQCVAALTEKLLLVENGKTAPETVNEMFRAAHSMKGSASFLNFNAIADVTHRMETILNDVRDGKFDFSQPVLDAFFHGIDVISSLLEEVSKIGTDQSLDVNDAIEELEAISKHVAAKSDDENGLGPLPDFIRGKLELDDVLEALVARNAGKRVFLLRLPTRDVFANHPDPLELFHQLENKIGVQATISLMEENQSPWLPLDQYDHAVAILCLTDQGIQNALRDVPIPACQAWELCLSEDVLPACVELKANSAVNLGEKATRLAVREEMASHKGVWLSETKEELELFERSLVEYEKTPVDKDILNELFRLIHRLKGSSASMGLNEMARVAHNCESLMSLFRENRTTPDDDAFQLLYNVNDFLNNCVRIIENGGGDSPNSEMVDAAFRHALLDASRPEAPLHHHPPTWGLSDEDGKIVRDAIASGKNVWMIKVKLQDETPLPDLRYVLVLRNLDPIIDILASSPARSQLENGVDNPPLLTVLATGDVSAADIQRAAFIDMVERVVVENVESDGAPSEHSQNNGAKESGDGKNKSIPKKRVADTVRVDSERLDHLMNVAGELAIVKSRISQLSEFLFRRMRDVDLRGLEMIANSFEDDSTSDREDHALSPDRIRKMKSWLMDLRAIQDASFSLRDAAIGLHRHTSATQNSVMTMRMIPIGPLFQRFHRLVRDLCKEKDRQASLEIIGEGTELDKKLIDELADPLTHLVRNAVDHGLESPEERRQANKPEKGRVRLEAFHQGGQIGIRARDDGRGLSREKIIDKARRNGLIDEHRAETISDQDVFQLIFQPGFSTAECVTNISGRGVGMDIVKSKINDLKGKIDIVSTPGKGCEFTIWVPLTLAMIKALLVEIGGAKFAVALESVREIHEYDETNRRGDAIGDAVILIRNQTIALAELSEIIGVQSLTPSPTGKRQALVSKGDDAPIAIPIDTIVGEEEIVVKSLSSEFSSVDGIAGATVLGDGSIALILDVDAIRCRMTKSSPNPTRSIPMATPTRASNHDN